MCVWGVSRRRAWPFSPRRAAMAELRAGPHRTGPDGMRPRARPRVVLGSERGTVSCPETEWKGKEKERKASFVSCWLSAGLRADGV